MWQGAGGHTLNTAAMHMHSHWHTANAPQSRVTASLDWIHEAPNPPPPRCTPSRHQRCKGDPWCVSCSVAILCKNRVCFCAPCTHRDAAVPLPPGSRCLEASVAATVPPEPLSQGGALQLEVIATHDLRLPAPLVVTRRLRSVFAKDERWHGRHELEARAMGPSMLRGWSAGAGCIVRDVGSGVPGVVDVRMELAQRARARKTGSDGAVHRRWARAVQHHTEHSPATPRLAVNAWLGTPRGRVALVGGSLEARAGLGAGAWLTAGVKTPALPPDVPCSRATAGWDAASWHAAAEVAASQRAPKTVVRMDGSPRGVRMVELHVRHVVPVFGRAKAWLTWRVGDPGAPTNGVEGAQCKARGGSSVALRVRLGKVPRLPVVDVLPSVPMVEVHAGVGVRTRALSSCGLQLCW